jgi:cytochrome c-type biogenesis protein CcmH
LKAEIAQQLAAGHTRAEVLSYFAGKYGEKILSAPTTTGFNLVAWVTPFAALLVAGAVIVVVSRRWRRPPAPSPTPPAPRDDADDAERRARLAAELDHFEA